MSRSGSALALLRGALIVLLVFLSPAGAAAAVGAVDAVQTQAPAQAGTPAPAVDAELLKLFDQAETAANGTDAGKALDLYREVAQRDGADPSLRHRAALRGAFLAWHVFEDADAARGLLSGIPSEAPEASAGWSERARLEIELTHDFAGARDAARRALDLAQTASDRELARVAGARAVLEQVEAKLAASDGKPDEEDLEALRAVSQDLTAAIETEGPLLDAVRLLLNAALLSGDHATALRACRWYYSDVPQIVPAPDAFEDPHRLALALAAARLYPEAERVLRASGLAATTGDAQMHDVLAYTAALRRVETLAAGHNRSVAQGRADDAAFEAAFSGESKRLWDELSWPASPPEFTPEGLQSELAQRFGMIASFGRTDGILTLLLGHAVLDESRTVEQHGHPAALRFVLLDGMVAGGYMAWVTGGRSGTGGWAESDAIYQIRPMYADDPVLSWRMLMDPAQRARRDEKIALETRLDAQRAQRTPLGPFRGLDLRLERQASEELLAELEARGLSGEALELAFLQRARQDEFESAIWAHEGRHAIDKSAFGIEDSPELEYRAKISQVVLAPIPRGTLGSVLKPIGGPGAHGIANERLMQGIEAWMKEHAAEISGLEADAPLVPQLDRLSDAQLRTAFASLDPQQD